MPSKKNTLSCFNLSQKLFILILFVTVVCQAFSFHRQTTQFLKLRRFFPYQFSGYKFAELKIVFKNVAVVGYYTDKNMDNPRDAMQFAQAQYVLAPAILDFNNLDHKFIIFDCSSPQRAKEKIEGVGAVPLKVSREGIILALRPHRP